MYVYICVCTFLVKRAIILIVRLHVQCFFSVCCCVHKTVVTKISSTMVYTHVYVHVHVYPISELVQTPGIIIIATCVCTPLSFIIYLPI